METTWRTFSSQYSEEIIALAKDWRADLIVLGTHGRRGLARLVGDAELVLRQSAVPVLMVRDQR